jgi:hypothetical protein
MKRNQLIVAGMVVLIIALIVGLYFLFRPTAQLSVSNGNAFGDTGSGTVAPQSTVETGTGAASAGKEVAPNLIEITSSPVSAGEVELDIAPMDTASTTSTVTNSSDATSTLVIAGAASSTAPQYSPGDVEVRYIDRESGNIYSYLALSRKLTRVTDKTLPGIQEVSWLPDGSMAFVRFLTQATDGTSHINTYALPFTDNGGYFLQQDLDQATVIGSTTVFVLTDGTDSSIGATANADGTNVQTLFTSPLTSIVARAAGAGIIAVTKASSELDGYAFSVINGAFTPIIGPYKGLTVLPSPSGKEILFSYTDGTNFHMATLDLTQGTVTQLPLATLAEKCVWTSDSTALYCAVPTSMTGNLPDDWYQGAVSFTDRIWRIDLTDRLATLVVDPSQAGNVSIDAVNLTLDPNSQVLVFRNKKDSSLWAYTL